MHNANSNTNTLTMIIRLTLIFLLSALPLSAFSQTFYHTGSTEDKDTVAQFGILLAGGGSDNNNAMRWLLRLANGGDVVVLRATGSDGYNNYMYSELGVNVNSVTSIVIKGSSQANNPEVCKTINQTELIFIAGGDQWYYYNEWKGTCLHDAINYHVNEKNAPIGGTSAGLAVLGEVVYTAQYSSATSLQALGNPFHRNITLANDFLQVPFLENVVTDSHYDNRDRKGRHVAYMARMIKDWQMDAKGIGVNEHTAVGVDKTGKAHVFGSSQHPDFAYFIQANSQPEICENGVPLHWMDDQKALSVYRIRGNAQGTNTFDLVDWQSGNGGDWFHWYVDEGVLNIHEANYLDINYYELPNNKPLLNIYPNPASDYLYVENNTDQPITSYSIFDITGRIIMHGESQEADLLSLNISQLILGTYILRVFQKEISEVFLIVRN